jgi:hypothetical protein
MSQKSSVLQPAKSVSKALTPDRALVFFVGGWAAGLGAGLGFGRATRPRYPRRRAWTTKALDEHDQEFRRGPPRLRGRQPESYNPWPGDDIDMGRIG